ncbi:MAG: family 20 glycosylhydrolase, partial [Armatimonadetes bacterium]|nr:family 20 glycosylhydrolase [Armatimonadota bacterium]
FRGPDGKELSRSRYFTVSGTRWRRYFIPIGSMYQHQRIPWDPARLTRIVFGGVGTCHYDVDHFAFQAPTHFLPLTPVGDVGPAPLKPRLEHFQDDTYELVFDPTLFPSREVLATVTVAWPGDKVRTLSKYIRGQDAPGEVRLRLPGAPSAEGQARLSLKVEERQGQLMYKGTFTTRIILPRAGAVHASPWHLLPRPKDVAFHARYRPGPLPAAGPQAVPDASVGLDDLRLDLLGEGAGDVPAAARDELQPPQRPEAYALGLEPDFLLLQGRGFRGVRWARQSLRQLQESEPLVSGKQRVPCVTVRDWPDLPVRAVSLSLPVSRWGYPNDPPVSPEFFHDFLRDMVVGLKYNLVVLLLDQGMKLSTHPEVPGPAAWPQSTVLKEVNYLRSQGIEVVPLLNSLGHANWICASHPELREDGDLYTLCTSNPATRQVLGDIYGEVLRVFKPRYFHIGMDECRWKTFRVPPEKRCKLCAGKSKAEAFAEQVRWLRDFFAERDVKTMMWGDMLLPAHNGGPPFNVAEALPKIPRDVIICNWSTSIDPLSSWYFASAGFGRIIQSNSLGVNAAQAPLVWGNMWGCWSKLPWLVELPGGYNNYNFLKFFVAAQYSWNLHPDFFHGVGLDPSFFTKHPLILVRHVLRRCRQGHALYAWAKQQAQAAVEPAKAAALGPGPLALPSARLGREQGRWLGLVVALECSDEQMKALRERLKDKKNWQGAPVARVTFNYADGTSRSATINFGYHLRAVGAKGLPYTYAGVALGDTAGWYAVPLENPQPREPLASVTIEPDAQVGKLHLAGARLFAE